MVSHRLSASVASTTTSSKQSSFHATQAMAALAAAHA